MAQLTRYTETVTIANGQALSPAIDLGEGRAALIQMPASWTAADLTFQASVDGTTFFDLYDDTGTEVSVDAAASRTIALTVAKWSAVRHLKIRSGTTGTPVNQAAARSLIVQVVG